MESRRKIIWEEDASTWEEVLCNSLHKDAEKEDSDWDEDAHEPVESQFEDAMAVAETCMDTVEESTAEPPPSENIVEASVGPGSQDMVQIHAGNDDDLE